MLILVQLVVIRFVHQTMLTQPQLDLSQKILWEPADVMMSFGCLKAAAMVFIVTHLCQMGESTFLVQRYI